MICQNDILNLKTDISEKIGQKIIVRGSLGRSKSFEKEAKVDVFDGVGYSPLIP